MIARATLARPIARWLLEREVEDVDVPESKSGRGEQQPWWRVVCLTGVDYFSTLGYIPGIAPLTVGALSPIATVFIVLLRPHLQVTVTEPDDLPAEVARLNPALVICGQPKPPTSDGERARVEFRPYDEASTKVCVGGRCARLFEPNLDDLFSVVDGAERLFRTSPDLPAASCLTSYGNGGETSG